MAGVSTTAPAQTWTTAKRWRYAVKMGSWPKLLVPMVLGQTLGVCVAGRIDLLAIGFGLAFTVVGLTFIVLLNDWGDQRVDRIKRTMFPDGCSRKTIPDRILASRSVLGAGGIAGLVTLGLAFAAEHALGRPSLGIAGGVSMLIFATYSLPPIRLNYRGGGEGLEMLGVAGALPWFNAYLQGGIPVAPEFVVLGGFALLSLASAVASGLADEESDRKGGKRTFVTAFGNHRARQAIELLVVLGALGWAFSAVWLPAPWVVAPAITVVCMYFVALKRRSAQAATNAFPEIGAYKAQLHHAIWRGTTVLAATMAAQELLVR